MRPALINEIKPESFGFLFRVQFSHQTKTQRLRWQPEICLLQNYVNTLNFSYLGQTQQGKKIHHMALLPWQLFNVIHNSDEHYVKI